MQAARTYEFSAAHFERVQVLVRDLMGIALDDSKLDLVYGRLSRRLRQLRMTSFDDYCNLIEAGERQETEHFINALTTNMTAFFREPHHFDFLAENVLDGYAKTILSKPRLRIWSAGCSTGEEAYSIAMTVLGQKPQHSTWDVRILATDIDSEVLAAAQAGVYASERISNLDEKLLRWMLKGKGRQAERVRVRPQLQELIAFKQLNLMDPWPFSGPFDCIFCRNVVIYFNKQTQAVLFDRIAKLLPIGGYLFIGHSESLYNISERFELIGSSIYQRIS